MADTDKAVNTLPPVTVTVVGTGDGLVQGTVATTPPDQPNIRIKVVPPLMALVARFANLFLTTLVGLVMAGMTPAGGKLLYTNDFAHLLLTCANLSLPIAALGFMKDLVTIFSRLEQKFPLATGSA